MWPPRWDFISYNSEMPNGNTCYENTHFKSVWEGQLVHNNVCLEYRTLWEYSVYDILDKHYYAQVGLLIPIWNVYFRNMYDTLGERFYIVQSYRK